MSCAIPYRAHPPSLALAASLLFAWACTDAGQPYSDGGLDGAISDGQITDGNGGNDGGADGGVETTNLGQPCENDADCVEQADTCLRPDGEENPGLCSVRCTPDDPLTPPQLGSEDSCPQGFVCGTVLHDGGDQTFCLQRCRPSLEASPCLDTSRSCHPQASRLAGGQPVCWVERCASSRDCPVHAGGPCTEDSDCVTLLSEDTAFCANEVCALPGACTAGGLCGPHRWGDETAAVGDRCQSDRDCPASGFCLRETDVDGQTRYRHGYCSIPYCRFAADLTAQACPSASTCHRDADDGLGLCFRVCALDDADDCRGGTDNAGEVAGDYECYDWTRLVLGGLPIADAPTCQAADVGCNLFGNVSCADFGDALNTTEMVCRNPATGAPTDDPRDPSGRCLDTTASAEAAASSTAAQHAQ